MSNEVFANGNEIACKSGDGKVIAAFPDVCLSPPSPPAGPVPVPYPNTSFAKDMKKGSKTVKIDGKEVMLKDKSFYKTSPLGDEAATKSLGAGVVSHVITGKTYFVAWSMDVKFEGKNVDRHIDFTTSNHASPMANASVPAVNSEGMDVSSSPVDENKCPCCNESKHSNQQNVDEVTEEEWYGVDDKTKENLTNKLKKLEIEAQSQHKKTKKNARAEINKLSKEQEKFNQTKQALEKARKEKPPCPNVPQSPGSGCGKYYKQKIGVSTSNARDDWDSTYRAEYTDWYATKKGRDIQRGEKINHATPIAAGGCPRGGSPQNNYENVVPDGDLSQRCDEIDKILTESQSDANNAWFIGKQFVYGG